MSKKSFIPSQNAPRKYRSSNHWLRFLVVILLVLGLLFRFVDLDKKPIWADETHTFSVISGYSDKEALEELPTATPISVRNFLEYRYPNLNKGLEDALEKLYTDVHPPLYFLTARSWVDWLGHSVASLRSFSAFISLLTLPCIYWLCLELFRSPAVGWMATVLLAVSPIHIIYAQEARPYSLLSLAVILSGASLCGLAIMGLVSLLFYEKLLASGNDPNGSNIPFQSLLAVVFPTGNSSPILRWVLVEFTYLLRCLPYVLVGMLLLHPDARKFCLKLTEINPFLWLFLFFICNAFGSLILPQAIYQIARGYTALLAAIALSNHLKDHAPIRNLALCSFGIYLGHLFFVEVFQSIAVRIDPDYIHHINTATLIAISILILLISWGATLLLMRHKNLSRIMFGH